MAITFIPRSAQCHTIPPPAPPPPGPCSCATPAVLELLGGEGVSERNLMQYLGVVEQRTNELLAQFLLLAADGSEDAAGERAAAVLTGKQTAQAPLRYVIEPPSTSGTALGSGAGLPAGLAAAASRAGDEEGCTAAGDGERPLSRGSLVARARTAVAGRAEERIKIKAVRGQASSSAGSAARR